MGPDLFQGIFTQVDTTLGTYVYDTAARVIVFVRPIFQSLLIVWIAIWGYLTLMGQTQEPLKEGVFRILRMGFILALGLTLGTYVGVVVRFLSAGPEQIAAVLTGSSHGSIAVTLDHLYGKVFMIADECFEKAGVINGNFGLYLLGFGIMLAGTALMLAVAFFLMSAKIMTAVLLGVGPIFIALLLFKGTQRFFESWLGLVCNYGMLLFLTAALGTVALKLANEFVVTIGFPDGVFGSAAKTYAHGLMSFDSFAKLVTVFGLTFLLVLQVPSIAAALGGGIALATQGIVSSTMNVLRPSSIRHNARHLQRDLRSVRNAAGASIQAFKKTFGRGNSISGN